MRRRVGRAFFILLCGTLATVLGTVSALLWSGPGRRLLTRLVVEETRGMVRGSMEIGSVSGRFTTGFRLERVVIRDAEGVVFAELPRLDVTYRLANLIAGRIVLGSVTLDQPRFQIIKRRSTGRLNYQEIFRLGEGPGGGASPLVELNNFRIMSGHVVLSLPWNPDGRLRTPEQRDSALVAERAKPGRRIEEGREGLMLLRTIEGLNADFPVLRISTPDRQPLTVEISGLEAVLSDPALDIRELRGNFRTQGDSLLFQLARVELPGTEGRAEGRIDWPQDTVLYHFTFQADKLSLPDVRFVSPFFPNYTGRARLQARSVSNQRTEWTIQGLEVGDSTSRIEGNLVAITDIPRGLGFRDLVLTLTNVDLDVPRPYLDTLPFHGRASGSLEADGFFDAMRVDLDWVFDDTAVDGGATNQLALSGLVHLGGAEGMVFDSATIRDTEFDLRTVREVAPAITLEGRLGLNGILDGPWKNVIFDGTATHRDGDRPPSRVHGRTRLDTRGAALALEASLTLDSLSFEGIGRGFPSLTTRGTIGGQVSLAGRIDSLFVDGKVGGSLGEIDARGLLMLSPPRLGADSLTVAFRRLDLAQLRGTGPSTRLTGFLAASGRIDSATAPEGRLDLRLEAGSVREIRFDSAAARLRGEAGRIRVDTAEVHWPGGTMSAAGALGWRAPASDTIRILADIRDLSPFDSLAHAASGLEPDTTAEGEGRLAGSVRAELFLSGAVDTFELDATATAGDARFAGYKAWNLRGEGSWSTIGPHFTAKVEADSVVRGTVGIVEVLAEAQGRADSLTWSIGTEGRRFGRLAAAGMLERLPEHRHIQIDSLSLDLLDRPWRLTKPVSAILVQDVFRLDTVRFATNDGSGSIQVVGEIPGRNPGQLTIEALGVQLRDLYGLAQRDTSEISGTLTVDLAVGGTSAEPTLRGLGTVTGPVFRDLQAPLIRAGLDYRDRKLRSNVTFWRTGKAVVDVSVDLPVDLAFSGVRRRQLPGPISIIAQGDSVDLALIEAFTPNLRQVRGRMNVDARVEGTWEAPRLAGSVGVVEGEVTVPGLGVRYSAINGALRFTGDSIVAEGLSLESEPGRLDISGGVRLDALTRPQFDLTLDAREFRIMDVENYMTLTGWGTVRIAGTVFHPVLTGEGALTNSVVYFTDLLTKKIINLEDPRLADLVDTLALREDDLRAPFQSQFLDSLTIRDLELRLGQGVWLRSTEANVQLEGRLNISKTRDLYQVSGDLNADRGTYTLRLPGLVRTFTVERGSIRYTNDLNAAIDILARHDVRTPGERDDVPIHASITGRLFAPKLRLTSPERPGLSEPEIISLLALGTTDIQGGAGGLGGVGDRAALAQAVAAYFSSVLASEAQSKVSEGGYVVELRPPFASSGLTGGGSAAQLSLGRALTEKLFVIANAGFCLGSGQQAIDPRNLGASVEYRFRRELRVLVAAEPITSCYGQGGSLYAPARRYQFGAELRWDREY
jgi:hypothetical protein